MAEIKITAMDSGSGPSLPTEHGAFIRRGKWDNGQERLSLVLSLGPDTVEVWPPDPDKIEALGEKLINIAEKIRSEVG